MKIRTDLLETFIPLNTLPPERLSYLVHELGLRVFEDGESIPFCEEGSGQTVYLLAGTVRVQVGDTSERISAGEAQSWYPIQISRDQGATVLAQGTVHVLFLDSVKLDQVLSWEQTSRYFESELAQDLNLTDTRWLRTLLRAPLFYRISAAYLKEMFSRMQINVVAQGEEIVRFAEPADACYFIKAGRAEVMVPDARGDEHCLAILGPGQYFGEEGLLYSGQRNATVRMMTAGEVLRLERADFDTFLRAPVVNECSLEVIQAQGVSRWCWLDVRLGEELTQASLPGAWHIPLHSLRAQTVLLEKTQRYMVFCDTGRRSTAAAFLLQGHGLQCDVLAGGLHSLGVQGWNQLLQEFAR